MSTVVLLITILAGFATSVTGRANSLCVPFRVNGTFCGDLPYNETTFPNIMGSVDVRSALSDVKFYKPLTILQCSDIIEGFICSAYLPQCDQDSGLIPPCRETCEAARRGCETVLNDFILQWPQQLDCGLFPFKADARCTFFESSEQPYIDTLSGTTMATHQKLSTDKANDGSSVIDSEQTTQTQQVTTVREPKTSVQSSKPKKTIGIATAAYQKVSTDKANGGSPVIDSQQVTQTQQVTTAREPKTSVQYTKPSKTIATSTTESSKVRLPDECKELPYRETFFPNVLGHWSFEEAVDNYNTFRSMLSSGCSDKLSKYLCLLHFSAYDESRKRAFPPCYEFCLKVRTQCLLQLPVPWPGSFKCESLPTKITPDSQCWTEDSSISTAPSIAEVFTVMQGLFQFVKSMVGIVTGL